MSLVSGERILDIVEATWPPAATRRLGPWTIRDGAGGGKRVSAATVNGPVTPMTDAAIPQAEAAMAALNQPHLFMIRPGEEALDAMLRDRGYVVIDPVTAYACETAALLDAPVTEAAGYPVWPPLTAQKDIWAAGGIGPARLAVMHRAGGDKCAILGRRDGRAAGTAFVAIHDGIAMLHALEVAPEHRRQGIARHILRQSAKWALDHGASVFSLVTTSENLPSNALYTSLNMSIVGHYHYRVNSRP